MKIPSFGCDYNSFKKKGGHYKLPPLELRLKPNKYNTPLMPSYTKQVFIRNRNIKGPGWDSCVKASGLSASLIMP